MTTRRLYVVNESTLVNDTDVHAMTQACNTQVRDHAAPAWGVNRVVVAYHAGTMADVQQETPKGSWVIRIVDTTDQAGALGWHWEDDQDRVYGEIAAKPCLDAGSSALAGTYAVSSVLSHEVLETLCVAPETRVLTRDLRWTPIGDIPEGELLIGFDEQGAGQGSKRRYQLAAATATRVIRRPCYEVTLSDGTTVVASAEHRWLVANGGRSHWVQTQHLTAEPHGSHRRSRIVKPLDVWPDPTSYEEGYIAAAFDGEGCLSQHVSATTGHIGCRLTFAQNHNAMLETVEQYLKELGIRWTEHERVKNGVGNQRLYVSNKADVLTVLGRTRPKRLLDDQFRPEVLGRMLIDSEHAPEVVELRPVGEREVVALTTSTGTYIAEGLASHNCDPFCSGWDDSGRGYLLAREVCDPVEADGYPLGGVTVSNFVLPEWFDAITSAGEKFDYLGKLTAPFSMSKGGYWVQMPAGKESQQFKRTREWLHEVGFDVRDSVRDVQVVFSPEMPEWRREQKLRTGRNAIKRALVTA